MKKTRLVKPDKSKGPQQPWLPLFLDFIQHLKIQSKDIKIDINDPESGKFRPFGSQMMALEQICAGLDQGKRTFVVLKARQLGITTIVNAIDIFWMMAHPGLRGAVVTDDESNRIKNRFELVSMIKSLPKRMRPKITTNSRDLVAIEHGGYDSTMELMTAGRKKGKDALGVGKGFNFAHCTEVSRWGDPAGFDNFTAALSERHPDRLYVMESTAHGMNHYKDLWDRAKSDPTMGAIFIGWWAKDTYRIERDDPRFADVMDEHYLTQDEHAAEREKITLVSGMYGFRIAPEQIAWYRWFARNRQGEEGSMEENYPWHEDEAFIVTGTNYFNTGLILNQLEKVVGSRSKGLPPVPVKWYRYTLGDSFVGSTFNVTQITDPAKIDDVELRVFEEPSRIGVYAIGCDPAYGRNDWQNNHALSVWRCFADKFVQVAEYATDRPETYQVAWVLAHLAGAYQNSIINYEVNGPGNAIRDELKRLRIEMQSKLYGKEAKDLGIKNALDTARWYLYRRPDTAASGTGAYGIQTTVKVKHVLMTEMRDSHTIGRLVPKSKFMLEEMAQVIQEGDTIGAQGRKRDDRVFAAALAHKAWLEKIRPTQLMRDETYANEMKKEAEAALRPGGTTYESSIVLNFFRGQALERQKQARIARWGGERLAR